uniref:Putative secreted protein n=1 Tax=Anopheles darlingi TaxID=43151 RepID=A0A2M4D9G9_ANODA
MRHDACWLLLPLRQNVSLWLVRFWVPLATGSETFERSAAWHIPPLRVLAGWLAGWQLMNAICTHSADHGVATKSIFIIRGYSEEAFP